MIGFLSKWITKSLWRCISKFSLPLAYRLYNPLANGKQELVPENIENTIVQKEARKR
jgi:hypothetical protein